MPLADMWSTQGIICQRNDERRVMRARIVFLAGLMTALCGSAVHAMDCKIRQSNLDSFARFRLGQHLNALPKGVTRLPNCAVYHRYRAFDCEFVDADGTRYLASGHGIVKLERGPEKSAALPLSYPLKFGLKFEDARRILSAIDPKIEFTTSHSEHGYTMETGECLKDRNGITYYFVVDFDKAGRLNKLTAAFDTAED
jgi:hypothetical protein